jgi:hypothetical protein
LLVRPLLMPLLLQLPLWLVLLLLRLGDSWWCRWKPIRLLVRLLLLWLRLLLLLRPLRVLWLGCF